MVESSSGDIVFSDLGCTDRERRMFAKACRKGDSGCRFLGRVVRLDRGFPLVCYEGGCMRAEHAVDLVKHTDALSCVGDWVVLDIPKGHDMGIISKVLPRKKVFERKDPAERTGSQTLAANIDIVLVLHAIAASPLNLRRLEREMVVAHGSGAEVAVVLTKADRTDDVTATIEDARGAAPGCTVIVTSAHEGRGIDEVRALVTSGRTAVLTGSSGVGKSSLVNALIGSERQETASVRATDGKGRHTTVAREMVALPGGGVLIDTPGVRALALWDCESGLEAAFPEIHAAAAECRFRDCTHTGEPGCAVMAAVDAGTIERRRVASYLDLKAEMEQTEQRLREQSWKD